MEEENNEQQTISLEEFEERTQNELSQVVEPENDLKSLFVNYVGEKFAGEDGAVTVEMCVQTLAAEFPEFLAPLCEQNFMMGYLQCEKDIKTLMEEQRNIPDSEEECDA